MKAKELMIGDWVQFNGMHEKVQEIAYDENAHPYISFACSATLFRQRLEDVHPIPLTEEILKANGWTCDYGDAYQYARHKDVFFDIYNGVASYEDKDIFPINYVHILQHALRLCGLTELADNFKLTTIK